MSEPSSQECGILHRFKMNVVVFGPVRPSEALHRQTLRALKSHAGGRDYFTEVTLHDSHGSNGMRIEYTVSADSPSSAERAGAVYISQLCDLISVATRSPVWFYMPDEDSREERVRMHRRASTIDRILEEDEWEWITGHLVGLRREHPRFLAAASWYRKGLNGKEILDDFCCFWRVIERLACSFADKSAWSEEEKSKSPVRKCVNQLASDLFRPGEVPDLLADTGAVSDVISLRNDLSHGNIPITIDVINAATIKLKALEAAAFSVLQKVRESIRVNEIAT